MFKMKKALLIGNGFTSQIIPDYSSTAFMSKVWSLIPYEMKKIEDIFDPFRIINAEENPYYYRTLPEYADSEDVAMVYTPTYIDEFFSPNLRAEICRTLSEKCSIKNSSHLCQKLFIDAGLCFQINKDKIVGIETPLKIIQIGIKNGSISKQEMKKIETTIKTVLFNDGNYHMPSKKDKNGVAVNRAKAQRYFDSFSTIFTTNYDLILDDFVHDKVKHLHGGFCFPNAYQKDYNFNDPALYEIVLAADGEGKKHQIFRKKETLFSKYLLSLATEDFDELHILGFSGENDNHINDAIRNNKRIKMIYVYVEPQNVNKEDMRHHFKRLYRKYPNTFFSSAYPYNLSLLSWNEFWSQILE